MTVKHEIRHVRIYTKTGDAGMTGLFAGPRVAKDHPRIEAYGAVDELSALLGVVVAALLADAAGQGTLAADGPSLGSLAECLRGVQSDLFAIGAELATPDPAKHGMCLLGTQRVQELEQWIDRVDEQLPPLETFILPGGGQGSALLQLGRTVCRRAERQVVGLSHVPEVHDCSNIIVYLNRLSDLLFVFARYANFLLGVAETAWKPAR